MGVGLRSGPSFAGQAEAIRSYTVQKQLGRDVELNAQEIVRRAERGLGLAIRKGQVDGTLQKPGQNIRFAAPLNEESRSVSQFFGYEGGSTDV